MYPYYHGYDGSFLAPILIVAAPLVVLVLFAWFVASVAQPSLDAATRIATQRFVRGEIDKDQLGVLLQAL